MERYKSVSATEEDDNWAEVWGDVGLQQLGRWLEQHDVPDDKAGAVVEHIWCLYSYSILPTLHRHVPLGITAKARRWRGNQVQCYLPIAVDDHAAVELTEAGKIAEVFQRDKVSLFVSDIRTQIDFLPVSNSDAFESELQQACQRNGQEYIGVFRDDVVAELNTIIPSSYLTSWLDTPNSHMYGRNPREFLECPGEDRVLRDFILRVKYGTP